MSLYLERSKDRLKKEINKEIMSLFRECLDYIEVILSVPTSDLSAKPSNNSYKVVRGKILRSGNNVIREVNKNIDDNYTITYSPETGINEDVIEFIRK